MKPPRIPDRPYRDSVSRIGDDRGWCSWSVNVDGQSTYEEGIYCLAQGMVSIYLQGGPDRTPASRIDFVHAGYKHTRTWHHRFTRPTIRRLARQFVAEIISKEQHRP